MRILMLAQFYPPIVGGIEQHVRTLSIELVARGHDVAVATILHKGQPAFEVDQGVRVYRVRSLMQRLPQLFSDTGRQYAPPFPDPITLPDLREIIQKEQPEIIHAHNWLVRSFMPLKSWSRAPLVVTMHDYNLSCARVDLIYDTQACSGPGFAKCLRCSIHHYGPLQGPPTVLSNWLMELLERLAADMFLVVSQAVAVGNNLQRYGQERLRVIPNFIPDEPDLLPEKDKAYLAQLPAGDYLLFAGGLGRMKGVEVLLRAYAELEDVPPLVLIGYPTPDWPQFSSICTRNVIVFKDWPHSAVMSAWARCMLAIVPSLGPDPCPTVAMEAMCMGKPIIASRTGGLTDIIAHGQTGLLIPAGDVQALKTAIRCLIDDPALRTHMGQQAQQRVTEFQARSVIPRIEQVYHDVLSRQNCLTPV